MHSDNSEHCCEGGALLAAISRAQEHFIREDDPHQLFDELLKDFLALTQSAYGFIGEILHTAEGVPYLKTHAISNVAWNDETRAFYEKHAPEGLEFFNLKTLFGAVIENGKPVLTNTPNEDPRSAGTPVGHPRLDAFLGVPVHSGDSLVGIIGVANRPDGYDETQIEFIQPLLKTYGQLIYSYRIRKQRDKASAKSEERFRNLVENTSDWIWEVDAKGCYTYTSPQVEKLLGYRPEEIIGRTPFELMPPDEALRIGEFFEKTVEAREPFSNLENVNLHKDGRQVVLETSGVPMFDSTGNLVGYRGIDRDITERKLAVTSLRESRERLQRVLRYSNTGLWDWNLQTNEVYFSPEWKAQLGYADDEVPNRFGEWENRLHPEDHDRVVTVTLDYIKQLNAASLFENEFRLLHKDGSYRSILTRASLLTDKDGKPARMFGLHIDITDRKKMENELRESSEILERIFSTTHFSIAYLDQNFNFTRVNRAYADACGYPPEFFLGKNHFDLYPHKENEAIFRQVLETGEPFTSYAKPFEFPDHPEWGVTYWDWSLYPMRATDGTIEGLLFILLDVTERKRSEEQIRKSEESLSNAQRIARLGNWDWDIVDNNLYWSDEIYRIFGIEPQEFGATYEAFLAAVHPADREFVMRSVNEALHDYKPYDIHHRIVLADGTEKIVRERAEITRNDSGRPLSMNGTVQDVTELKKAELSLRESESRFRTLVEQSPFVMQIYSSDGRLQIVNRAFEQLWEMNLEMLAGYNILKDPQLVQKGIMPYIEMGFSGKPSEVPAVVYDPAQNPVHKGPASNKWIRSFIYPVLDDAGNTKEVILFQEDVTEQKKAEEQLRQAAAVFEHTAEAVVITDPKANILDVNRAFTEITGYARDEVLGHNPRLLKSLRHDSGFYETMWDSLVKAGYWRGEIWNRRKNGEIFPVWSTISAVHDDTGRLTHYVSVFSDISSLKHSEEQLYYLAHHDPLTDLPNRLLFTDRIEHAMVRARREKYRLALLFLDLDRFKNINDGFGHPTGDKLLQEAARRIVRQVREEDTVARLGGDEFVVLMEEINESADAAILAAKLVNTFSRPFAIDNRELHVTVSIGISIFPEDGNDATLLIRNADAAMYRAKEEGRDDFQFYTRELTSRAFEKVLLETSLRRALEREEFTLYYQPQFSLATGEITGAEALLRWKHPAMGLILPGKFIQLAEETGIILSIGEWALRTACAQMCQWQREGFPLGLISVNISQTRFQRGDLEETVRNALNDTGLDPNKLELEITETVLTNSPERAISTLSKLRKMGVSVALDDFGTGYSSLSHLKNLPLNKLKIDQSFVRNLPFSPNDKGIVIAIIALGWIMGLKVTAEGVETDEQRDFLRNQGCKEYQGYLGGHPMPAEEFTRFLSRKHGENRGKKTRRQK